MSRKLAQFWPFGENPEGEIYESLSWDLPGFRPAHPARPEAVRRDSEVGGDR